MRWDCSRLCFPTNITSISMTHPRGGDMFSDQQPALSHGCIHPEHAAELVAWLLRDKPGWTLNALGRQCTKGATT